MVQQLDKRGVTRYRLLETMRHYGADHIGTAGAADELSLRHVGFYANFVELAAAGLQSPDEAVWAQAFDVDFDNVRIAVGWALDQGHTDLALRLISPPWTYILERLVAEPGEWAEQARRARHSGRPLPGTNHGLRLGARSATPRTRRRHTYKGCTINAATASTPSSSPSVINTMPPSR